MVSTFHYSLNDDEMNISGQSIQPASPAATVSDDELVQVITDFLAMGHVDNIVAMFRQDHGYYQWTGRLVIDSRYAVRLGVAVLFEQLKMLEPETVALAVPSLAGQLDHAEAWVRGEAANLLGIIGTTEALASIQTLRNDPSRQVVEIVCDILGLPLDG